MKIGAPPSSVYRDARRRHHALTTAFVPGTIGIGGEVYIGSVYISGQSWEQTEGGYRLIERCVVTICKERLAELPGHRTTFEVGGNDYRVVEDAGQNDFNEHWRIRGTRILKTA